MILPDILRDWWTHVIQTIIAASGRPIEANQWIKEVEDANDETDLPITPSWQTLDVKIANGLFDILEGNLKKEIILLRSQLSKRKPAELLSGRHIALKIQKYFERPEAAAQLTSFEDLLQVKLRNKATGLRPFITEWCTVLEHMPEQPEEKYLVHLFRKEVEQSDEVKLQYEIERRSAAREKPPRKMTYQDLMDMCKLFLADQLKHKTEKQYDARHEPQPQASVATERVAGLAPRGPRKPANACPYWVKYGKCNKKDDGCPYEHNEADRLSAPAAKGKAKAKARAKSTPPARDRTPPPPTPLDDAAAQRLARQPRTGKSADGTVAEAKICTFYLHQKAGNCRSGANCNFHHPPD